MNQKRGSARKPAIDMTTCGASAPAVRSARQNETQYTHVRSLDDSVHRCCGGVDMKTYVYLEISAVVEVNHNGYLTDEDSVKTHVDKAVNDARFWTLGVRKSERAEFAPIKSTLKVQRVEHRE